ncbi:MAG: hypothetical protein QGH45_19370 [Myxococcota bacterium]|nr:hypothetical protein [Myxococcota bacterium]
MTTKTLLPLPGWLALSLLLCAGGALALSGCNVTPGDDDDDDASDDDDDDDDGGLTIYDLQQDGFEEDQFVTLEGVIVTTEPCSDGFFVQEPDGGPYSGLYVYTYSDALDQLELLVGDIVTVAGGMSEWYGMTEMTLANIADIQITGATDAPAPEVIDISDLTADETAEPWESVLIQASGTVTSGADSYGEWAVDDVKIDDQCHPAEPGVGTQVNAIIGVIDYAWDNWRINPRSDDDLDLGEAPPPETATIYEIQEGEVNEGPVTVEDVVVTSGLMEPYSSCEWSGFFVQEQSGGPYSGIMVALQVADFPGFEVNVGDVVTVSGDYSEFYDLSELTIASPDDVEVTDTGAAVSPATFDDPCGIDYEAYEGVLIKLQATGYPLEVTTAIDEYGEFELNSCLAVDDAFFENESCGTSNETPDPPQGTYLTALTGVMTYTYEAYKLEPRSLDDYVGWP